MSAALDTALQAKILTAANFATHAPGGCHNLVRPQGSAFPVVVFSLVGGVDDHTFSGPGVEALNYDVRVIAPATAQANVGTLLEAIHDVLERQALAITGYTHLATLRQRRGPAYPENVGGVMHLHRVMTYTIWMHET